MNMGIPLTAWTDRVRRHSEETGLVERKTAQASFDGGALPGLNCHREAETRAAA
jgi:hypothetical protein